MSERPLFSNTFSKLMTERDVNQKRLEDIFSLKPPQRSSFREIRELLPELSNNQLYSCFYSTEEPDSQKLAQIIKSELLPWLQTNAPLPVLTLKQLSRLSQFSPESLKRQISQNQVTIELESETYLVGLSQTAPNTNPKQAIKKGRYFSRPPGGGPAQKIRNSSRRIKNAIKKIALNNTPITLTPLSSLDLDSKIADSIDPNPLDYLSRQLIESLKIRAGKKWLYDQNSLPNFKADLAALRRDEPVDFVLWNCLEFSWINNGYNQYPSCEVNSDLSTAISVYFQPQITQFAQNLLTLGPARFTILTPSSEVTDPKIWSYTQSLSDRLKLLSNTTKQLQLAYSSIPSFQVQTWSQFLASQGEFTNPIDFTDFAQTLITQSPQLETLRQQAIKSDQQYLNQFGINLKPEVLRQSAIRYFAMYYAEGLAFAQLRRQGKRIVLINLEEYRVPQLTNLGSAATLPIITPVSSEEINNYYQWKKQYIRQTKYTKE